MNINELIIKLEWIRDDLDNNTSQDSRARDSFWELNDVVAELNTNGLDNGVRSVQRWSFCS